MARRGTHVYLTQNEFDALVSFVYNPGRGWPGVRAAINTGDKRKAVRIIEEQVRSGGRYPRIHQFPQKPALKRRRKQTDKIFYQQDPILR
ncbi:glycoside hydrolase family protein [Komagataeibacter saccharivorans]|uniref:glycoside hydrolase family protein n=1 Tax=Komagataeibacter saccharivorans TaxID=265959 RepID=UPI0038CF9D25